MIISFFNLLWNHALKKYSRTLLYGRKPLNTTPHYSGQFSLSLGKALKNFSNFNPDSFFAQSTDSHRMSTSLIRKLHCYCVL